jgi:hypothetical protein
MTFYILGFIIANPRIIFINYFGRIAYLLQLEITDLDYIKCKNKC